MHYSCCWWGPGTPVQTQSAPGEHDRGCGRPVRSLHRFQGRKILLCTVLYCTVRVCIYEYMYACMYVCMYVYFTDWRSTRVLVRLGLDTLINT